jgi:hypothetical protein
MPLMWISNMLINEPLFWPPHSFNAIKLSGWVYILNKDFGIIALDKINSNISNIYVQLFDDEMHHVFIISSSLLKHI